MRTIVLPIIILLFALFTVGCEEDFSPRSEFKEGYVLFSITAGQEIGELVKPKVILAKVYDVPGTNPYLNTEAPEIAGARVEIRFRGDTYILKDSTVARQDSSRYDSPMKFYFGKAIPLYSGDTITITARLANGVVLTSGTRVPSYLNYESSIVFPRGFTSDVDVYKYGKSWSLYWASQELNLCFPKMKLYYTKKEGNREISKNIEIPLRVINRNGVPTPLYPVANRDEEATYELASFDWAMEKISEGEPDKSLFRVLHVIFEATEYDAPLSNYYSSVNGFLDNFSLRLDEQVFSNITGGFGVFGTYFTSAYQLEMDSRYVQKYGYNIK
jgi:hypothetical protein